MKSQRAAVAAGVVFASKDEQYREDVDVAKAAYLLRNKQNAEQLKADLKAAKDSFKLRCQKDTDSSAAVNSQI